MRDSPWHRPAEAAAFWPVLLVLIGILTAFGPAHAGCSVSSPGLAFGSYQPFTTSALTSNASVSIACTGIVGGGSYSLALGPTAVGPGDRISTRYLANPSGGDFMAFNVYTDASHSIVWGDSTAGSMLGGNIAVGDSNQLLTVYGRIPAGQNTLKTGSFSGGMTVTLTYNP